MIGYSFYKQNLGVMLKLFRMRTKTSVGDNVFQVSELVEPYRVAPSIDLEENSIFYVFDNSLIDVDAEELNVVLSSSGQA